MNIKTNRGFFDLSPSEKEAVVKKASQEAKKMMDELVRKADKLNTKQKNTTITPIK